MPLADDGQEVCDRCGARRGGPMVARPHHPRWRRRGARALHPAPHAGPAVDTPSARAFLGQYVTLPRRVPSRLRGRGARAGPHQVPAASVAGTASVGCSVGSENSPSHGYATEVTAWLLDEMPRQGAGCGSPDPAPYRLPGSSASRTWRIGSVRRGPIGPDLRVVERCLLRQVVRPRDPQLRHPPGTPRDARAEGTARARRAR